MKIISLLILNATIITITWSISPWLLLLSPLLIPSR
jgi:hypothetical protein